MVVATREELISPQKCCVNSDTNTATLGFLGQVLCQKSELRCFQGQDGVGKYSSLPVSLRTDHRSGYRGIRNNFPKPRGGGLFTESPLSHSVFLSHQNQGGFREILETKRSSCVAAVFLKG